LFQKATLVTGVGFFSVICIFALACRAGESDDFFFAEKLRKDGMYVAAAEEFVRFTNKYPHSSLRPSALVNAGECYMKAGKAREALEIFSTFLDAYPDNESACKVRFYRGIIFKKIKQYDRAADEMIELSRQYVDCSLVQRAMVEAGDCLISEGDSRKAAAILKQMLEESDESPYIPRARYILALALVNMGRDLQAEEILNRIVDESASSPFAAMALIELGDRAVDSGNSERAIEYYQRVVEKFEEKSLRERALRAMIDVYTGQDDDYDLLTCGNKYIELFPESGHSDIIFKETIYAAWRLNDYRRALSLIESAKDGNILADSLGEFKLLKAKILYRQENYREALFELENLIREYPASNLLNEVYLLRAESFDHTGSADEAFRCYNLALGSIVDHEKKLSVLSRIASLSLEEKQDTLSALGYLDMIVQHGGRSEVVKESLWRIGNLREKLGDRSSAVESYRKLVRLFSGSELANQAKRRIEYLSLTGQWTRTAAREVARIACSALSPGERALETGVITLDKVGDSENAKEYLNMALQHQLSQKDRSKALYYLAEAYFREYRLSELEGDPNEGDRDKALGIWTSLSGEQGGGVWREKAHRSYLEQSLSEWDLDAKLRRLNDYISIYQKWPQRFWAVERKVDLLYSEGKNDNPWAVDSALAISEAALREDIPAEYRKELVLRCGYLSLLKDNPDSAARHFRDFISNNKSDVRVSEVLYDLGEVLFNKGNYREALESYLDCLKADPYPSLAARCNVRSGDCYYSLKRFPKSIEAYRRVASLLPQSKIAQDAKYRCSLALVQMGKSDEAEKILTELYEEKGLATGTRVRLLRKLGNRLLSKNRAGEAATMFAELVSLGGSADDYRLLAAAKGELGELSESEKLYTTALGLGDVDTCLILGERAKVRLKSGEFNEANEDIEQMEKLCTGFEGIPDVFLEKAKAQVSGEMYEGAQATLEMIRVKYPHTPQAVQSLYYMALCDLGRGGHREAVDKLENMLRESPTSALADLAYFKLASSHYKIGNKGLAARNYRLAAESTKDENLAFMAWKNVAHIYQEMEDYQKAALAWEKIAEKYPGKEGIVEIFFNLGFCYNRMNKHELAYRVYNGIPVIAIDNEQTGRAHYWAGISLKNMKKYREAVREFLRVPYLIDGMWGVTAKLEAAECYEHLGEFEGASKVYQAIIKNMGENSDWGKIAVKGLKRIEGGKGEGDESQ
jgi:TolA-binding protein